MWKWPSFERNGLKFEILFLFSLLYWNLKLLTFARLTYVKLIFPIYIQWKHQKTSRFLCLQKEWQNDIDLKWVKSCLQFRFTLVDPGIYEGDMELSPEQLEEVRNGKFSFGSISNRERLWPNINGEVVIPYYIEKSLGRDILCFFLFFRSASIQLLGFTKVQVAENKIVRIGRT